MLKLTVAFLGVALAGTASAAKWQELRIDASSEAAFTSSVETFQRKLPPLYRYAFEQSLRELWLEGTQRATIEQSEYTSANYFRELDGLTYDEVVELTDPTGEKWRQRYWAQYSRASTGSPGIPAVGYPRPVDGGAYRGASRAIDRGAY